MAGITFSEGSGVGDSVFGKSQAAIRLFIEKKGEAFEQESVVKNLFSMQDSQNFAEKVTGFTAMQGFLPVGENGAHPVDRMEEDDSKTLEHMTWKNSFSISREMVDDSVVSNLKKQPAGFVTSYYRTREKFGAALYGGALNVQKKMRFSGVDFDITSADGKTLFAVDHPSKIRGKAQSNQFSDAFSADALAAAETAMQNFRGTTDEILDVAPNTILIPNDYQLKKEVFAVIGADKDPATANNGFNYLFGRWNVVVWPYLNQYITAGAKPWLLLDTDYGDQYGGAVWYDRVKLEVKSDIDADTDANVWRGYARFIAGFGDWRHAAAGGIPGGSSLI